VSPIEADAHRDADIFMDGDKGECAPESNGEGHEAEQQVVDDTFVGEEEDGCRGEEKKLSGDSDSEDEDYTGQPPASSSRAASAAKGKGVDPRERGSDASVTRGSQSEVVRRYFQQSYHPPDLLTFLSSIGGSH
jgi:hypothetical protein